MRRSRAVVCKLASRDKSSQNQGQFLVVALVAVVVWMWTWIPSDGHWPWSRGQQPDFKHRPQTKHLRAIIRPEPATPSTTNTAFSIVAVLVILS